MGIDYVIDLPCAPKHALGTEGIVQRVKAGSRAGAVLDLLRADGDARPPAEVRFDVVVQTPEGTRTESVSVQGMIDQARTLEPHRPACAGCPADRGAGGFGCYRSIPYPIAADAEAWLLGLLPDDLGTTAGRLLVRAVADFAWDGAHAARMRADGDAFFESREALAVAWGDVEIDTNQLFHMLFHVGAVNATHAFMACLFFGLVPHDAPLSILADAPARARALAEARIPDPPTDGCAPIAAFLATLAAAARLDLDVLVDA